MTGIDSKRQAALDKLFEAENELVLHYDQRPEPVAYCYVQKGTSVDILTFDDAPDDAVDGTIFPLYTTPPKRAFVRAIEAKLKEERMKRPIESDYTSQVAYTRALEAYCDTLEQPATHDNNFCPRCGKRRGGDVNYFHTCTPPRGLKMT